MIIYLPTPNTVLFFCFVLFFKTYVCAYAFVEAKIDVGYILQLLFTETKFLTELQVHQFGYAGWPASYRYLTSFVSLRLGLTYQSPPPCLFVCVCLCGFICFVCVCLFAFVFLALIFSLCVRLFCVLVCLYA